LSLICVIEALKNRDALLIFEFNQSVYARDLSPKSLYTGFDLATLRGQLF